MPEPTSPMTSTVTFQSSGPDDVRARVTRGGPGTNVPEEELLTLNVKSLTLGREDVSSEITAIKGQTSIVTVVALTWAT